VVLYHYTFSGWAGHLTSLRFPVLSLVTRYGYLGVDLFFLISGFVVLLSAWNRRPREFVVSRMVRLYPAFWVAVTITAIIEATLSRDLFEVSPAQYLANLTMANSLPNIGNVDVVYWTLWAEIRFYLIILALTWIGITRRRVLTLMWTWLAATAIIEAHLLPAGLAGRADLLIQSQWSHYFIGGMALCLIYRTGLSWVPSLILVICFGNALYQAANFARRVSDRYHQVLLLPVVLAIITVIFIVVTLVALQVTRPLGRPWFAALGALTYPLYLVHAYSGFTRGGGGPVRAAPESRAHPDPWPAPRRDHLPRHLDPRPPAGPAETTEVRQRIARTKFRDHGQAATAGPTDPAGRASGPTQRAAPAGRPSGPRQRADPAGRPSGPTRRAAPAVPARCYGRQSPV